MLDGLSSEDFKRYIHHYNMPPYATGEAGRLKSPGRREIGHGALAERALLPVIPSEEEFPYAMRLVSEILSSNGSSSMASVCGSTLSLMDAGVPIHAPVAGVAMGLIKDTHSDKVAVLTDIQGLEDFYGDMDFKVAGTKKGITAIQVDIKVDGLTPNIIKQAFEKCRVARYGILDEIMLKAIPQPREDVSDWAPKMTTMHINPDKIREVIGKGGSVIQNIVAESGAKVDIEDDGTVTIAAVKATDADKAKKMIEAIVKEPEPGEIYYGKVVRLMNFGAFVNLLPGKDGMVHISELSWSRIKNPAEVVSIGDHLDVYVISFDPEKRKISLGVKDRTQNPWDVFMNTYKVGDVANVRIVKLMTFGAFAEVVPGVDGLIHISQIADRRIDKPSDVLSEGQMVDAKITAIDEEKKKISLSIRALLSGEEEAPVEE